MNWDQFLAAVACLESHPVPLGSMSGIAHDNATRDILKAPPGRALNNDYTSLIASRVRGDFVWLGPGTNKVQADGSGGHPALLGMRTGYCAGRIEDYGFFFHSGHFHPEVEHAIPFLIDFITNSCSTLAGGARDAEVDRLSRLPLQFYKPNSTALEDKRTTFAELAVKHARLRAAPAVHAAAAAAPSGPAKGPIVGYKDGPFGMKLPIYGNAPSALPTSAASTNLSDSALAVHQGLGLHPGPQPGFQTKSKGTIAQLPPTPHLPTPHAPRPTLPIAIPGAAAAAAVKNPPPKAEAVAAILPPSLGVSPTGLFIAGLRLPRARWMPDGERTKCARCHTDFTFMTRKHHCRKCGDLVCNACSPNTKIVKMPASPTKAGEVAVSASPVRVCSMCVKRPDL